MNSRFTSLTGSPCLRLNAWLKQSVLNCKNSQNDNLYLLISGRFVKRCALPWNDFRSFAVRCHHDSCVAKGGEAGAQPPIFQTKHKHMYKLRQICQFGQFIFGKIIKIVAIRSHLLKLKWTQFDFG